MFSQQHLERIMVRLAALGALCLLLGGCYYPYPYNYGYGYPPPRYGYAPPPSYNYPPPPYPYGPYPGQAYGSTGYPQTLGPSGDTAGATGGN